MAQVKFADMMFNIPTYSKLVRLEWIEAASRKKGIGGVL